MKRIIGFLLLSICCNGGFAVDAPLAPAFADKTTYFADITRELQMKWPTNHTVNIVCHGHSVVAGYFKTPDVRTFDAYPHLMHVGLKERFTNAVINVIVTAIGGENSESGAKRFESDVLTHRPELVTIDYALNDRKMGVERARKAWSSMIEMAQAHGVKVLLLTPTPDISANLNDPADQLNRHAEMIRALAKHYHVGLVDSLAAFKDYEKAGGRIPDLMAQANHPNRKGHELVAKALLEWFP
jgi:lysophospholipase L1-like esterase